MTIQYSRVGLSLLAQSAFVDADPEQPHTLDERLKRCTVLAKKILNTSPILNDLNLDDPATQSKLHERLNKNPSSIEKLAQATIAAANLVVEAIGKNDTHAAANAGYFLGQVRSLLVFESDFADASFQGHDFPAQIRAALEFWNNSYNSRESTWQSFLTARPWLLNMVTSSPVILVGPKAYLGGKTIENREGSEVDYVVKNPQTTNAAIIEIKTPNTPLLSTKKYRNGVHAPSYQLTCATQQAATYRQQLVTRIRGPDDDAPSFGAWNPGAILRVGDTKTLDTITKKRSFELYRAELRHIRVVTYDELFASVAALQQMVGDSVVGQGRSLVGVLASKNPVPRSPAMSSSNPPRPPRAPRGQQPRPRPASPRGRRRPPRSPPRG